YVLVLFLFLLGFTAKTIASVFPAAILILLWWKRGKLTWKRDLKPLLPFFPVAVMAGIITAWMEQNFSVERGETFDFSIVERFLIAGRLFWFYLGKIFWPANLIMINPTWRVCTSAWAQYLFLLAPPALCGRVLLCRRTVHYL